jgi:hypothetical protein
MSNMNMSLDRPPKNSLYRQVMILPREIDRGPDLGATTRLRRNKAGMITCIDQHCRCIKMTTFGKNNVEALADSGDPKISHACS